MAKKPSRSELEGPEHSFLNSVNINNPDDTKLRSKRTTVRSHVAYRKHKKSEGRCGVHISCVADQKKKWNWPPEPDLSPLETTTDSDMPLTASSSLETGPPTCFQEASTNTCMDWTECKESGIQVDPFMSFPVPWKPIYGPILDHYLTYILIDTPDTAKRGCILSLKTSWYPFIMTAPITFYSALAFAATSYHVYNKLPLDSTPVLELRHQAITAINEALSNPLTCTTDLTVCAVLCMSYLESMFGDAVSYDIHMSGMETMVRLRGGLEFLGLNGLIARMIIWLDFSHATLRGSPPYFDQSQDLVYMESYFMHPGDVPPPLFPTSI